jgi:hypothetical protein
MEVAGVNKITLYENKGVSLLRSVVEPEKLISISNSGTVDEFNYCVDVGFESEVEVGLNYTQLKKDKIEFYIQDFNKANRQLIERFQNSKCGYLIRVDFESGLNLLINNPMFFEETEKDFNKNSFVMSLAYKKQSELSYLDFSFENSLILTTTGGTVGITTENLETQSVDWGDGSKETLINNVEAINVYPALPIRNYDIILDNLNTTELLKVRNSNITGSIDLSTAISLYSLDFLLNNGITDIKFPENGVLMNVIQIGATGISNLDLSNTVISGRLDAGSIPSLISVSFKSSGNGIVNNLKFAGSGLTILDLTNVPISGTFDVSLSSNLSNLTFASSGNGSLSVFKAQLCDLPNIDFTVFANSDNVNITLQSNNFTATEHDNQLINLDATGWINGSLTIIAGNTARTAASDTAFNNLITKGWTIT